MQNQTRISLLSPALLAITVSIWATLAPVVYAADKSTETREQTSKQRGERINVNAADAKTLETLPGVGAATAQKIIEGRPYHNLADLEKVKGLSQARVEALKGKVSFAEPRARHEKTTEAVKTTADESQATAKPKRSTVAQDERTTTPGAPAHEVDHASAQLAPGEKININTASAEELDRLPGIGHTKAQAIVDYRNANGKFASLEDIEKVRGIKAGTFSKIKDYIKLTN